MRKIFGLSHLIGIGMLLLLGKAPSFAQAVVSDGTAGTTVTNNSQFVVTGGTQELTTLFHSFGEFSPQNINVLFELQSTQSNVEAVIGRVTGTNESFINGQLSLTGGNTPDVFLINPNGIIFGDRASLRLPGSFTASTADSILFPGGKAFQANASSGIPTLTISTPTGLQLGDRAGNVRVNNSGHSATRIGFAPLDLSSTPPGLSVAPGNTLALVGRDVILTGGLLSASSGQINLTALKSGQFSIAPDSLGSHVVAQSSTQLGQVQLQDSSLLNVSGLGNGNLHLQGNNISLQGGSLAVEQIFGSSAGGTLRLLANDVELSGSSSVVSQLRTQAFGPGLGGRLAVTAQNISIAGGGAIGTDTFGPGQSGDISINSDRALQLTGAAAFDSTKLSSVASSSFGPGQTGKITVAAGAILIEDSASISSVALGSGNGGDVQVTAQENIHLTGATTVGISTINAITFGEGDAGDVVVSAPRITLGDAAGILTSTLAAGDAGRLTINTTELLEVSGEGISPGQTSISSAAFSLKGNPLQAILGLPDVPTGNSGEVIINAADFVIRDGGLVSVAADGPGQTGKLTINSDRLTLRDLAEIKAITASGNGGAIALNIRELLSLSNQSTIDAESFGTGNGGNIAIQAPIVIGTGNSDIIANAVTGAGGNISIETRGIFGLVFRDRLTSENDITANSEFGISGVVNVNDFGVSPDAGLVALSTRLAEPNTQVAKGCATSTENQFVASGRGGIPVSPEQSVSYNHIWSDVRNLSNALGNDVERLSAVAKNSMQTERQLTEASDWQITSAGEVELLGIRPHLPQHHAGCTELIAG